MGDLSAYQPLSTPPLPNFNHLSLASDRVGLFKVDHCIELNKLGLAMGGTRHYSQESIAARTSMVRRGAFGWQYSSTMDDVDCNNTCNALRLTL